MSVTEASVARKSTKSRVPPLARKTSLPSGAWVCEANRSLASSVAFFALARKAGSSPAAPEPDGAAFSARAASSALRSSVRVRLNPGTRKLVWRSRARSAAASYSLGRGKICGSAQ